MKKIKAQQITEFMLTAPLLIMFFVVLTEFAFAFNTYVVLNNALKSSVGECMKLIDRNASYSDFNGYVNNYVYNDMKNNKIPNLESLDVNLVKVGSTYVAVGNYTYEPGLTFHFLPALRTIKMQSAAVFSIPVQDFSEYDSGITTEVLNTIQPPPPPPPDSDGDGTPDYLDPDDDNDGILDVFDAD